MVKVPHDYDSAQDTMILFNNNATDLSYRDAFDEALRMLYKGNYKTVLDPSNRLNIRCMVCEKSMNSTQATQAHNNSPRHLKMVETNGRYGSGSTSGFRSSSSSYSSSSSSSSYRPRSSSGDPHSIKYQLQGSKSDILGLHLIEEYTSPSHNRRYCKCNLCGSHGRPEAIVNHVIGNTHTDNYLRARVAGNLAITSETRGGLRAHVCAKDRGSVEDIKVWRGIETFPFKWEDESVREEQLEAKYKNSGKLSPIPPRRAKAPRPPSPKRLRDSSPLGSDGESSYSGYGRATKVMTSKQGVLIIKDERVESEEAGTQVFSYELVERLLNKLAFIGATEDCRGSYITCQEDATEIRKLMYLVGLMLHTVLQRRFEDSSKCRHDTTALAQALEISKKLAGTVMYRFVQSDNERHFLHGIWHKS